MLNSDLLPKCTCYHLSLLWVPQAVNETVNSKMRVQTPFCHRTLVASCHILEVYSLMGTPLHLAIGHGGAVARVEAASHQLIYINR